MNAVGTDDEIVRLGVASARHNGQGIAVPPAKLRIERRSRARMLLSIQAAPRAKSEPRKDG
jgi:hypothetical protein